MLTDKMSVVSVRQWRVRSVADIRCFVVVFVLLSFVFCFVRFYKFCWGCWGCFCLFFFLLVLLFFFVLFFTFLFEVTFNNPVARKFRWTSSAAPKRKWCRQASSILWKSSVCEDDPGTLKNKDGAEPAKSVLIQQAFTSLHAPFKLQRTCNMPITSRTPAVWREHMSDTRKQNSVTVWSQPIISHTARVVYSFLVDRCVCRQKNSYSEIATNLSLSHLF